MRKSLFFLSKKGTWFAKTQSRTCERRYGFGSVCVIAAQERDLGEERNLRGNYVEMDDYFVSLVLRGFTELWFICVSW